MTDKTPGELATEAAEAIRALNHRTLDKASYENPAEAGAAAYALRMLVERLPQTLDQLRTGLLWFGAENTIRMDDETDLRDAVAECSASLLVARQHLRGLLDELALVSARSSHMGGQWPEHEDDDES
ncbi:hypothetical protein OG264_39575 (plasmid) [Streptomyces xanthophaeus]|uniref:hypothetical protein n=1 Tax=Streptomyces xanthophaeus TaxID=67385 RepID=UPI002F907601|nr:hypothetical protein OG264_39730 [Streptomyces xanthophaeus]WST27635.1 hypothetical protein OG264_39575 [Streptomyces xanthophaeus]WST65997.1 hypothetical protein OG605_41035 [Streptomyces xanthophaeus]WST66025.1 hypothetical protein OG605_40880 [Streptomyces xanthophaeus]